MVLQAQSRAGQPYREQMASHQKKTARQKPRTALAAEPCCPAASPRLRVHRAVHPALAARAPGTAPVRHRGGFCFFFSLTREIFRPDRENLGQFMLVKPGRSWQGRISAWQLRARVWHTGSEAPGYSSLPDSLHLRRCLRVLSSALRSGMPVSSSLSQAKDHQLAAYRVPKCPLLLRGSGRGWQGLAGELGSGSEPVPAAWSWCCEAGRGKAFLLCVLNLFSP